MTLVDINKRRRIFAKAAAEEEKQKLLHLSITQSVNKKRRIYAKDEDEKGTYAQQHLSNMFPHEIMFDILSRLPIKQLMRFRCVSKSWNYLIRKDQFFINMHFSRSKLQHHEKLILKDYECNYSLYSLDYNQGSNGLEPLIHHSSRLRHIYKEHNVIWGSCNGLICTGACYEQNLYISNPSTTEYRKLPYFKGMHKDSCYGFGYNPNTNDYVVVRLTCLLREKSFLSAVPIFSTVSIYSLSNNSWKQIQNIPYQASELRQPGQLVNGSLHWVAHSKHIIAREEFDRKENAILAFEITTEKFVEVPCPDDHHGFDMIVGQYQGKLCFYHDKHINRSFDLWVMNEYKVRESWTKLFNIRKPKNSVHSSIREIVLCSTKEGSILMRSSMYDSKRLILYDPKRRTRRPILGINRLGEVNTYVPSIVSV